MIPYWNTSNSTKVQTNTSAKESIVVYTATMDILNQRIETVPIDKLEPHPRNPRRGDVGTIKESIGTNGFYGAIVVQESTNYILAGNHRYLAAKASGANEIPVVWLDIDDTHALRILLADNRTNDIAEYDDPLLAELLNDLVVDTGTLDGTGFTEEAVDELLGSLDGIDVDNLDMEDNEPSPPPLGNTLKFGTYKVTLTDEELSLLTKLYRKYEDEFGLSSGFVKWLLKE